MFSEIVMFEEELVIQTRNYKEFQTISGQQMLLPIK